MILEQEKILRANVRELIKIVNEKRTLAKKTILKEEKRLRSIIRSLINVESKLMTEASVPDGDPTPNKSTGINVLEDLLKKIIPVLQIDFKLLTTDKSQRESFRAHIINAVVSSLTPAEANNTAHVSDEDSEASLGALQEAIDVAIGDDEVDDKFIDIRTDAEKSDDEEEPVEEDPINDFGVDGQDTTGRNVAFSSYKKIESNIIDAYELLSNEEDQELFYDYLIANLKLYFDKFEDELSPEVEEPTNQAYDDAKGASGEGLGIESEESAELGAEDEEIELDF